MGDLNPTTVGDDNNNSVEFANTVLKANNILGVHVMKEKEELFYQWADCLVCCLDIMLIDR